MLDKAMRNLINNQAQKHSSINVVSSISEKLYKLVYNDKTIYLTKSLIAKEICRDTFYLGINPILECFLDSEYSIVVNDSRKNIQKGKNVVNISGIWGDITISSPIDLVVHDKIGSTSFTPFNSRWFAIIGDTKQTIQNHKLSKIDWHAYLNSAIKSIEEIKTNIPSVGDTMMDGGTNIEFLHQLLGYKKYVSLLSAISL